MSYALRAKTAICWFVWLLVSQEFAVDEGRKYEVKPLVRVGALSFFQCFDIVGWVAATTSARKNVFTNFQKFSSE